MKLILWIDGQILKFFTKIVKDFNWLTGKDNFFLAKIILVTLGVVNIFRYNWMELAVLLSVYFPLWLLINFLESNSEKEQIEQAKILSDYCAEQNFRLRSWVLMIFSVSFGEFPNFFTLAATTMFLVAYLISIDKPPFKKSQAWQKVKGWFSPTVAVPQAEPIPVRAN